MTLKSCIMLTAFLIASVILVTLHSQPQGTRLGCTIDQTIWDYEANGTVRSTTYQRYYVHSNGNIRHEVTSGDVSNALMVEYFNVQTGQLHRTYSLNQTVNYRAIGRNEFRKFMNVPASCETAFHLPPASVKCSPTASTIAGVPVQQVTLSSDGARIRTYWIAPGLNFRELRAVTYVAGVLQSSMETTKVQLGDPDPSLWQLPAGYARVDDRDEFSKQMRAAYQQASRH